MVSYEQAVAMVTGPGSMLEIGDAEVFGRPEQIYVKIPGTLRELFAGMSLHGDKTFLVYEDERYSFAEVSERISATAAALVEHFGVAPGDRVAIAMRNYPEWIITFAAVVSIGAISVSLNSWWTADELDFALEDSGTTVLVADTERVRSTVASARRLGIRVLGVRLAEPIDGVERWEDVVVPGRPMPEVTVAPDGDATILYTSGTTSRPKGAVSTNRAVTQALAAFAARAAVETVRGYDPQPPEGQQPTPPAFILIVPLFHVTGCVAVMLSCAASGTKLVMMYRWDPERALQLIEREKISHFVGVPAQSWDLVNSPAFATYDTSSLRRVGGGGAPAPPALVATVADRVSHGTPNIGYGLTETNAYGPQNAGPDYLEHPASTGRMVPPGRIEIRDADGQPVATGELGEVWFHGPFLIRGYWNRPAETAAAIVDGWLRTGDLGRVDAGGFLYIEDRVKDMILRGGENVYSVEVEGAIYDFPGVHEAAVFGIPDERFGEEVAVAVYPAPGATIDPQALRAFVGQKLAAFKVPSRVFVVDEPLPRNAAGKFLKRELRDQFG